MLNETASIQAGEVTRSARAELNCSRLSARRRSLLARVAQAQIGVEHLCLLRCLTRDTFCFDVALLF
jgi:hypothetical protein